MLKWADWKNVIIPMLGKLNSSQLFTLSHIPGEESDHDITPRLTSIETLSLLKIAKHEEEGRSIGGDRGDGSIAGGSEGTLSLAELQQKYDMLHISDQPLNVEDAATIISGSLSLIDGESQEEEKLESMMLEDDERSNLSKNEYLQQLAEKKRQLQRKLELVNLSYQKAKDKSERKQAVENDDLDGFQLFRPSYQNWRANAAASSSVAATKSFK
jgi:hypothetical protein